MIDEASMNMMRSFLGPYFNEELMRNIDKVEFKYSRDDNVFADNDNLDEYE